MAKFKELLKSPHIHLSIATGLSIIVLAYFSKNILPEPIGYLNLAIPPFMATITESLIGRYKDKIFLITWLGIAAVLIATILVIVFHMKYNIM